MGRIVEWEEISQTGWNYRRTEKECDLYTFYIDSLPDFSEPRFQYLSEKTDDRPGEIAKKQLKMLRQIHSFGKEWGISLRIQKEEHGLKLYFVFRHAGFQKTEKEEEEANKRRIASLFPEEYTLSELDSSKEEKAMELSWANYSAEIYKQEDFYKGNTIPFFYSCSAWTGISNDMIHICAALLKQKGNAVVDVTLVPTYFSSEESQWMNNCIQLMKEAQMGERLKDSKGKVLMQYDPLPILKNPCDNYDKLEKRYATSNIFLTSLRIFAEQDIDQLCSALIAGSVKNMASYRVFHKADREFALHCECFKNIDISPEISSEKWLEEKDYLPYRAQRLVHLADVEEIANFFRIPIPIENRVPGFQLDTGLGVKQNRKKSRLKIELGEYLDDSSGQKMKAYFDCQQLAKHGLIVGVPGSGKTTAMFHILHQLWDAPKDQRIPFIVLEPAKTEFRALLKIPHFKDDMLVFTLGDDSVSPFRFNPFEVLPGVKLESHISRLNACFVGAFDLFDPLPLLLDQAIRRTYQEKGWYDDSMGGEIGTETPTLSDLCRNAEYVINYSGFDSKMVSDFKASLLQRLNSLRRGSKGRMLDTKYSIPMKELMEKPVILELDSLNEDEKALMMMFLLSYVYEYCKVKRKSGSPLKHMLLVEEAHNLIGSVQSSGNDRANPKEQTINLFVKMLAEMRALGQGILIADQLPTAIASQAVKQTNVKILMRVTSKDDREEIGNTMDLSETEMKNVVHFKTGHAYVFHEELDRVRLIRMVNYKDLHGVEEPPDDEELRELMSYYEKEHEDLYLPYPMCHEICHVCDKRVRSQAEQFAARYFTENGSGTYFNLTAGDRAFEQETTLKKKNIFPLCTYCVLGIREEKNRLIARYGQTGSVFPSCTYIHLQEKNPERFAACRECECTEKKKEHYFDMLKRI